MINFGNIFKELLRFNGNYELSIFVYLNRSFHVDLHIELWTLNEYFKLSMTQSLGEGFDARQSFTAVPPELKSFPIYLNRKII